MAKKKKKGKKIYTVGSKAKGDDFDKAEIELLIYKIARWFASEECDRVYDDPMEAAKEKVQESLLAKTADGSPWQVAPNTFEARIKSKCLFDMETDTGISVPRVKAPHAVAKRDKDAIRKAKNLSGSVNFDAEKFRESFEKQVMKEFPELDNPAHRPNIRRLSLILAQQEEIDRYLDTMSSGDFSKKRMNMVEGLERIQKMADSTMKSLGIHPDQVRKKLNMQEAGTVGDLVATIENDEDWREREEQWRLTLALQLYWMSLPHEIGPRAGRLPGVQLHPWDIWHMTRSRPIDFTCPVCSTQYELVEGFEPQELYDYLVGKGVLVEEPVIPQLTSEDDLKGIDDHFGKKDDDDSPEEEEVEDNGEE